MENLKINEEFKSLIPPLTNEEYYMLETSIAAEGCRDALITWQGYIIDGHNRYEICKKHNVEFNVLKKDNFETESDVKLWMINNQIGKRNLTNIQKAELAIAIEKIEQILAKERQLANLKQFSDKQETAETSLSTVPPDLVERGEPDKDLEEELGLWKFAVDTVPPDLVERARDGEALVRAAQKVGVGYETVRKTKRILEKAPEEVIEKVRKGEVSIDRAYHKIQRAERLEKNKVTEWPKGKYRIIYADPPWKYGDERSGMGGAADQYSLMDLEDIKALEVKDLAEEDSVLFMWGTAPLLKEALEVIEVWGFQYKTHMVWNKQKGPQGNYVSPRHELLFIATKGSCTPDTNDRPNSVQTIERTGRHSEKPQEFRSLIEQLYTYGNKIELFTRKQIEGWEGFGNEI